jgi:hypothetical protein
MLLGVGAVAVVGYLLYTNSKRISTTANAPKPPSPVKSYVGSGLSDVVGDVQKYSFAGEFQDDVVGNRKKMVGLTNELDVQDSDWVRFTASNAEVHPASSDWVRADGDFFDTQSSTWLRANGAPMEFFQTHSTSW